MKNMANRSLSDPTRGIHLIQWLDRKRWNSWTHAASWDWARGLSSDEIVLTHWLTYVTDRQMPVEEVWSRGSSVFKEWVKNYTRHRNFQSRKHYSKRSGFKGRELHFKSRFHPEDFRSIEKTLKVLRSYDKSLVLFVSRIIERYPERDDIVDRIACALYLLTYDTHRSPRDVLRLLR